MKSLDDIADQEPTLEELTTAENYLIEASNWVCCLRTTRELDRQVRLIAQIDSSLRIVQSWKELYDGRSNERPE